MARPQECQEYRYNAVPKNLAVLDGPNATFKLATAQLPALQDDQLLVKTLYLSNDPAQRGWLNPRVDPERLYAKPVQLNTRMHAYGVCEVIESKHTKFKKGDHVTANPGWGEFAVVPARDCTPAPPLPRGISETHYLGAVGNTGLTAYYGLVEVARAKPTDIVVVSGAAGATGSMAIQVARHLVGCRKVIGIAGG